MSMRYLVTVALSAFGCTGPAHVLVEPQALVSGVVAQDTEAALEIGWDEALHMAEHPRPRVTWYLPCVAPVSAAGDTLITYAESCSANCVTARGDVALRHTASIASSWFPEALVGYKGYVEGHDRGYSGDRADVQRVREAIETAGL